MNDEVFEAALTLEGETDFPVLDSGNAPPLSEVDQIPRLDAFFIDSGHEDGWLDSGGTGEGTVQDSGAPGPVNVDRQLLTLVDQMYVLIGLVLVLILVTVKARQ